MSDDGRKQAERHAVELNEAGYQGLRWEAGKVKGEAVVMGYSPGCGHLVGVMSLNGASIVACMHSLFGDADAPEPKPDAAPVNAVGSWWRFKGDDKSFKVDMMTSTGDVKFRSPDGFGDMHVPLERFLRTYEPAPAPAPVTEPPAVQWVVTGSPSGFACRWNFDAEAEARDKHRQCIERGDATAALYRLVPELVAATATEATR